MALPAGVTKLGTFKGEKGDKGDRGDQGLPGSGALPTGETIAAHVAGVGPARDAVDARVDAALGASAPMVAKSPALSAVFARFATSRAAPVRVVGVGSSSIAGEKASSVDRRFFSIVVDAMQKAYPAVGGVESSVVYHQDALFGSLSSAAGVHGYNAGQGGTTSAVYLTDAECDVIGAMNPALVIHQIGSNDRRAGIAAAAYKANVRAKLDRIDAAAAGQPVHVLVHAYPRFDNDDTDNGINPPSTYGDALRSLAAEQPASRVAVDLAAAFAPVGVPGTDPLDLVDADKVHPNDAGHLFTARLLLDALHLPVPTKAAAAAVAGRVVRLTSDAFSGADTAAPNGRTADAALGGVSRSWALFGGAGQMRIVGGVACRGTSGLASFAFTIPELTPNVRLTVKLTTAPVGNGPSFTIHRTSPDITGTPDGISAFIDTALNLFLRKRVGGVMTTITGAGKVAVGDDVGLEWFEGAARLLRNGVVVASAPLTDVAAAGYAGVAGGPDLTDFGFDNFRLDLLEG